MRTLKNVVWTLILSVALFSCSKDDDSIGDISLDGTLTGTISNYTAGAFDAIKCIDGDDGTTVLGSCTPSSNGTFSMKLSIPTLQSVSEIGSDVTISDTNTKIGVVPDGLAAYKSNNEVGVILKTDLSAGATISSPNGTVLMLIYADRACTIKGTIDNENFNLNLKKGWNEVAGTYQESSSTLFLTTTIPSNLKWRYFPTTSSMGMKKFQLPSLVK